MKNNVMITSIKEFENNQPKLSNEDKKEILELLKSWSGGFAPNEIHWQMDGENDEPGLHFFINNVLPEKYDKFVVEEFFKELYYK